MQQLHLWLAAWRSLDDYSHILLGNIRILPTSRRCFLHTDLVPFSHLRWNPTYTFAVQKVFIQHHKYDRPSMIRFELWNNILSCISGDCSWWLQVFELKKCRLFRIELKILYGTNWLVLYYPVLHLTLVQFKNFLCTTCLAWIVSKCQYQFSMLFSLILPLKV